MYNDDELYSSETEEEVSGQKSESYLHIGIIVCPTQETRCSMGGGVMMATGRPSRYACVCACVCFYFKPVSAQG
jgi:hypothetical protein